MEFTAPADFNPRELAQTLRDDHGYLGPVVERRREDPSPDGSPMVVTWDEPSYYPTVDLVDRVLHIEARTETGSPIDERSREAIQAIIDSHAYTEPPAPKTVEELITEATSFADLKQRVANERARQENRRP